MKSGNKPVANELYALVFGLFLGLCILKFGNPVILDQKIFPPESFNDFWNDAWPIHWVNAIFAPLAIIGAILIAMSAGPALGWRLASPQRLKYLRWLLILPLLWFGWELLSATQSIDPSLTAVTLWQFGGCVACYFIGAFLFRSQRALHFLLAGILVALSICLIRAVHQHFEFPQTQRMLIEGQRTGWTNFPPEIVQDMRREQTIITTNGVDIINPALVSRFAKNRVMGTLVYPNALAGIILLLLPVALVLVVDGTKQLRPLVRVSAIAMTIALALVPFFWSGSKFGWLLAIVMGGLCLLRLKWPTKLKIAAIVMVTVLGLGLFAIRFHSYFEKGATSVTARFDYWRAAVQITRIYPLFGSGPGTFQHPYQRLKAPDAEMARLAHNDYLQQFCDSGIPGGILYSLWIVATLIFIGQYAWKSPDKVTFAVFLGLLAWFIQGLGEFELFIPALAWMAFTLLGYALGSQSAEASPAAPESIRQKPARG
jgi:hypothetical protein